MWFGGAGIAELLLLALGLAFWGGLITLIFLAIRWFLRSDRAGYRGPGGPSGGTPADDPFEILRRRYAAGEIDDEEYARRRKTLAGK
jgi:putative membrane protein